MIDKLEMLIALAREQHFGRAAESLGITQPTLSAGIKQLESQLGVQLVWRGSRYGGLTPEGARALDWARRIVGDARTLREEMRAVHEGLAGTLRIAVVPTALTVAARLTSSFCAAHPGVHVSILSRSSVEIVSMIENLEADAGVTYLDNEPLGRMVSVPLYREEYHLVCPSDAPLAGRAAVEWGDLAGLPLCLLTPDMQNRRIVNQRLFEAGVVPEVRVESNSTVVLMSHVATGGWSTILPREMAEFLAAGRRVTSVPIRGRGAHAVGLIAPWREPHTPVLEALIEAGGRLAV
ncbi:LysR family transcriptional regulator [Pseudooceanicola nanhaiensis]|jgi:DNA-binding transcriptional LysR family regulator|uniref:LysR family transcriptional regulator n=1 Tax=Pseudooceanicola nanhaiensis TaxID=375761 RepID=A0A917T6H7_9RHOB|nr:LysR family transcriptional regulator [Pseudooceanicola nanhaiensis]GGM11507.1 LysR family transcriptional regulator [Pseudooceanicola nanhaiensis]